MRKSKTASRTRQYERLLRSPGQQSLLLRLFVAGMTYSSQRAVERITALCEQHLKGRYRLEIVDIYQQPELAQGVQIVAVPTLVKMMPSPLQRFIGDMSKAETMLLGLAGGKEVKS